MKSLATSCTNIDPKAQCQQTSAFKKENLLNLNSTTLQQRRPLHFGFLHFIQHRLHCYFIRAGLKAFIW